MYENKSNVKVYQSYDESQSDIVHFTVVGRDTAPNGIVFVEFLNSYIAAKAGGDWAFPEEIRELNLTSRGLTEFPESIRKMVNLQTLMLGGNQIQKIPDWICELQNLKELFLHNNSIEEILQSLEKLKNLTHVSLELNPITTITPQVNALVSKGIVHLHKEISVSSDTSQIPTAKVAKTRSEEVRKSMTEKYWEETLKTHVAEKIKDAIRKGESRVIIGYPTYFEFVRGKLGPLGYEMLKIGGQDFVKW